MAQCSISRDRCGVLRDGQWAGDIEQRTKDGRTMIAECGWTLLRGR